MKNPINTDLGGKVAVVTGAGGVICSVLARSLAAAGAKVALLDLDGDKARACAAEIAADGGTAIGYKADVLDRASLAECHARVARELGKCDILINGAGGNNPRATTDKEYYEAGDVDADTKSFFDLDKSGVEFVFDLNFIGTLLPTQEFARDMVDGKGCNIINISSMNAYTPLTKIPAYSGAKAAVSNFTQWLAVHFSRVGIRVNAIAPGFFATAHGQDPRRHAHGQVRRDGGAHRRDAVPAQRKSRFVHNGRGHSDRRRLQRVQRRVTRELMFVQRLARDF